MKRLLNLIHNDTSISKEASQERKKALNSITKLAICFVCLLAVLALETSWAWLRSNRKMEASNLQVLASSEDIACEFIVYGYDLSRQMATDTSLVKNNATGLYEEKPNTLSDYDFNTHDAIFAELNEYTMVLVQIDVTGQKIQNDDSGTIVVTIARNTGKTTSSEIAKSVSNVLSFSFFGSSTDILNVSADGDSTIINEKWKMAKQITKATTKTYEEKEFISSSGNSYITQETISFSYQYTASDIYEVDDERTVTLFLALDYSEDYVREIILQEGVGSDFDNIIPISNDLKELRLTTQS